MPTLPELLINIASALFVLKFIPSVLWSYLTNPLFGSVASGKYNPATDEAPANIDIPAVPLPSTTNSSPPLSKVLMPERPVRICNDADGVAVPIPTLLANLPSPNEPVEVDEPLMFPVNVALFDVSIFKALLVPLAV